MATEFADGFVVVGPFGPGLPARHHRFSEPLRGSAPRWRTRWPTPMRRGSATATSNRRTSCSTLAEQSGSPISGWRKPKTRRVKGSRTPATSSAPCATWPPSGSTAGPTRSSDVYALGTTLYEMLTLRPAFVEPDRLKLIDRISNGAVPSPRSIDPRIPNDLETIVLKAMARETSERYLSARSLAEDLERFLADRSILARRSSARERAWRWCRRNPHRGGPHRAGRDADDLVAIVSTVAALVSIRQLDRTTKAERRHSSHSTSPQEPSAGPARTRQVSAIRRRGPAAHRADRPAVRQPGPAGRSREESWVPIARAGTACPRSASTPSPRWD